MPNLSKKGTSRKSRVLKVLEYLRKKSPVDFVVETEEDGPQFSFKEMQEKLGKPDDKKVRKFLKKLRSRARK